MLMPHHTHHIHHDPLRAAGGTLKHGSKHGSGRRGAIAEDLFPAGAARTDLPAPPTAPDSSIRNLTSDPNAAAADVFDDFNATGPTGGPRKATTIFGGSPDHPQSRLPGFTPLSAAQTPTHMPGGPQSDRGRVHGGHGTGGMMGTTRDSGTSGGAMPYGSSSAYGRPYGSSTAGGSTYGSTYGVGPAGGGGTWGLSYPRLTYLQWVWTSITWFWSTVAWFVTLPWRVFTWFVPSFLQPGVRWAEDTALWWARPPVRLAGGLLHGALSLADRVLLRLRGGVASTHTSNMTHFRTATEAYLRLIAHKAQLVERHGWDGLRLAFMTKTV